MHDVNTLTGRALDRAIAEALGWKVRDGRLYEPSGICRAGIGDMDDERTWELAGKFGIYPRYATDANPVINECDARGWKIEYLNRLWSQSAIDAVQISIPYSAGMEDKSYYATGETTQEAGARALLLALLPVKEGTW